MSRSFNVAVAGATGAVGHEMIKILEERAFPVKSLKLLASPNSEGKTLEFHGKHIPVEVLREDSFAGIEIALFSAGGDRSKQFAPHAAKAGAVVIDNSSAWRMDPQVPLVVPEVNAHAIKAHKGIIANPNCSTIQMVVALNPLHKAAKIKRVVVSTYQSVSGAGQKGIDELSAQIRSLFSFQGTEKKAFPHTIAFNCLPQIDVFEPSGYTKEEMKMVNETRKIMETPEMPLSATTVRVPVFYCHSESVNVEFEKDLSPDEARKILRNAPGVEVVDDPEKGEYPMALEAAGKDAVFVGRIRRDDSVKHGLNLWIVSDNLRKGAALNAVQIAEELIKPL
ncbi:MAG: aspartate-semialdehyde dehydrogenase [Nitrospinae bacterium]|nr:aspartate-semialdehyde dehydrogenase [Nitrospinota bacterium]